MSKVTLGDVCVKSSSNIAQKDLVGNDGQYPIFGASGFIQNVDFYQQDAPYIAVVKDGAGIGRTMLLPAKSSVIGTMQYIIPKDDQPILLEYLYHAIVAMNLGKYFSGATIPHIYFKDYQKEPLNLPDLPTQRRIASTLDAITALIAKRHQQLDALDQLVKSRFVEMFGDPVSNSMALPTESMTAVCEIIDGDRGKNYPKQDDFFDTGFCLFLNAKNVTSEGFSFENCMFITEEKDKSLHNGKLQRGDVVLTTRGTLGNLAYYDDSVPFENVRINSGMVILRMKKNAVTENFFIEQFKLQLKSIKEKVASGSAQPQLPISTMNKIQILLAPMELQQEFISFITQTDQSKSTIRQSLQSLETLKKSLMQQYFG